MNCASSAGLGPAVPKNAHMLRPARSASLLCACPSSPHLQPTAVGSQPATSSRRKSALTQFGVKISLAELKQLWIDADKDASSGINFDEFVSAVERLPKTLGTRKESMLSLQAELSKITEKKAGANKKKKAEKPVEEEQQQCQVM